MSRISRISRIFFSNFYKSVFSIFTYRKLEFQKSEIFKHLSKTGISKIRDFQHPCFRKKIRDFQTSVFSIFTIGEYRKHGCLKTKFSIFTIGEYRKHGFIKVGEKKSVISEKSAFSTWPTVWRVVIVVTLYTIDKVWYNCVTTGLGLPVVKVYNTGLSKKKLSCCY